MIKFKFNIGDLVVKKNSPNQPFTISNIFYDGKSIIYNYYPGAYCDGVSESTIAYKVKIVREGGDE